MKMVVIGGTGLTGSKTIVLLRGAGHDALAAAPNTGVNTVTGEGLERHGTPPTVSLTLPILHPSSRRP